MRAIRQRLQAIKLHERDTADIGRISLRDRIAIQIPRRIWVPVLLTLIVGMAFPVTAVSLWSAIQSDTPLAYLGLIPVLAFLTAVGNAWRSPRVPWRSGIIEALVAFPLLLAAIGTMYAGPRLGSLYFWYNRGDLLALVCFGVATAIVLFGVGPVLRSWFAILYLFLVWPAPYQPYLASAVGAITDATVSAIDGLLAYLSMSFVKPLGNSLYSIGNASNTEVIGVDSPCAGASGMFGFIIVAIPCLYLLSGQWSRKLIWFVLGLTLLWLFNLVRIFALFSAAAYSGTDSNLFWWTHALLGLLLFAVAIAIMFLIGYRFGFRLERRSATETSSSLPVVRPGRPAVGLVALVALLAVFMGDLNRDMDDALGLSVALAQDASIPAFADAQPPIAGFQAEFIDQYDWAKQFFGRESTFRRYAYYRVDAPTIWVDSVVTKDKRQLDLYNVQGCYGFHGYDLRAVSTVDVGYGITAQQIQFVVPSSQREWVVVTWTWPVQTEDGDVHERLTLFHRVREGGEISSRLTSRTVLERMFGVGNGSVPVGPEAHVLTQMASELVAGHLGPDLATRP